jgi:hypothetical protein
MGRRAGPVGETRCRASAVIDTPRGQHEAAPTSGVQRCQLPPGSRHNPGPQGQHTICGPARQWPGRGACGRLHRAPGRSGVGAAVSVPDGARLSARMTLLVADANSDRGGWSLYSQFPARLSWPLCAAGYRPRGPGPGSRLGSTGPRGVRRGDAGRIRRDWTHRAAVQFARASPARLRRVYAQYLARTREPRCAGSGSSALDGVAHGDWRSSPVQRTPLPRNGRVRRCAPHHLVREPSRDGGPAALRPRQ